MKLSFLVSLDILNRGKIHSHDILNVLTCYLCIYIYIYIYIFLDLPYTNAAQFTCTGIVDAVCKQVLKCG